VDTNVLHLQFDAPSPLEARRGAAAFTRAYLNDRASEATAGTDYASIISPADLPEDPASPNWIVNLAAAFVLGLGLGVAAGWAYLLRARQADVEAAEAGAIASLGVVPAGSAEWLLDGVRSKEEVEAYRRLRAHVLAAAGHAGQLRSVVVTSPRGSAASTSVAMQLGAALAQAGYRTVVVAAESDPSSLALLGIDDSTAGLTTLLVERGDPQALLFPTGVERLSLLPPGGSSGVSDVLAGRGRRATFSRLAPVADFAVVDAGGVLTSATALEVTRDVPVALLVIAEDEPARDVVAATAELRRQGAQLLGTVVWVPPSRRTRRSMDPAELSPGFGPLEEDPPVAEPPPATRAPAKQGQWQRAASSRSATASGGPKPAATTALATAAPTLTARSRK
jgi:Mrp family chromosome partitioning ATPase